MENREALLGVLLLFLAGILRGQSSTAASDTGFWLIDIDEVVVTAQFSPVSSKKALHRIRRLDRQDIEARGAVTLEQLLQQELNVRVSRDRVLGSGLSLNGVSGQNVQIMIDGVPVIGRVGDHVDLGQITLTEVERVEIVDGPMSVQYGTNALGGVVNLITRKSQVRPFEGTVETQYQGIGWAAGSASVGYSPSDRLLLRANGGGLYFDGFNPPGTADGADGATRTFLWNPKNQRFFGASARYRSGEEGSVRYSINMFREQVRNPGMVRRPQFKPYAFDDEWTTQRTDHQLLQEGPLGKHLYVQTTAGWNQFHRVKNSWRVDLETADRAEVPGMADSARFSALMLRPVLASRRTEHPLSWQAGLDLRYETGSGQRIRYLSAESGDPTDFAVQGDYALFANATYAAGKRLQMQLGARIAHNTQYRAPVTPSLHLKYDCTNHLSVRASWARGFRTPSLKERFFYFVDANHFIVGNEYLTAETSSSVQIAADWKKAAQQNGLTAFSILLFANDIRDKIGLFQFEMENGMMVPVTEGGSLQYAYFNQSRFRNQGANMQIGIDFGDFSAAFGYAPTALYNPLSAQDPTVRPWSVIHEVSSSVAWRPGWHDFNVNLFVRHQDRLISYYETIDELTGEQIAGELVQDGFTMADLTMGKSFASNRLSVHAGVQNLLNVSNIAVAGQATGTHAGGDSQAVAVGRTWFVRLRITLGQDKSVFAPVK